MPYNRSRFKGLRADKARPDEVRLAILARAANAAKAGDVDAFADELGALYVAMGPLDENSAMREAHSSLASWFRLQEMANGKEMQKNRRLLHGWFEDLLAKKPIVSQVSEVLSQVSFKANYIYSRSAKRFDVTVVSDPSSIPPLALFALALTPLFDDNYGWGERLVSCGYRNCKTPYFFVFGKRSGQRFCSPQHSNTEHQYRFREDNQK
jgi:hypothetical protein